MTLFLSHVSCSVHTVRISRSKHFTLKESPIWRNIGLQFFASGSFDFTWNPPDFIKSTRFHEIWQISGEIWWISCEIHPKPCESRCFNQNYPVWWIQERGYDPGFHEIWGHSPLHAPPHKLKSFCWNIWFYKVLGGFQNYELLCDDQVWVFRFSKDQ